MAEGEAMWLAFKETVAPNTGVTPNETVNRVIGAAFGLAGFGFVGALGLISAWKHQGVRIDMNTGNYVKAFIETGKFVYDLVEPYLRAKWPEKKEQFYWIDQALDWCKGLIDQPRIQALIKTVAMRH